MKETAETYQQIVGKKRGRRPSDYVPEVVFSAVITSYARVNALTFLRVKKTRSLQKRSLPPTLERTRMMLKSNTMKI